MAAPRQIPDRNCTAQGRAQHLRASTTPAEQLVWSLVRGRRLGGLKFRRQHPLGSSIADFYCRERRLVLELDGESHESRRKEDVERSEYRATLKLDVLRISNDVVYSNLEGVAVVVLRAAGVDMELWLIECEETRTMDRRRSDRRPPHPGPLPHRNGGEGTGCAGLR